MVFTEQGVALFSSVPRVFDTIRQLMAPTSKPSRHRRSPRLRGWRFQHKRGRKRRFKILA